MALGDPLGFIKNCVANRRVYWTYHVNMRMRERFIARSMVSGSVNSYKIIESYPEDKYLPSYLVRAESDGTVFHVLFAVDETNSNVRVITAYLPDKNLWDKEMGKRL